MGQFHHRQQADDKPGQKTGDRRCELRGGLLLWLKASQY
jgi:hypothetical protein